MFITSKGRYVIMAMIDMMPDYKLGKITPLKEIAARQEISVNYLEQLFMKLKNNQIIKAVRGPKGGYTFCKNPSEIYLIDVLKSVEEVVEIKKCQCTSEQCKACCIGNKKCNCHTLWVNFETYIYNYFSSISIQDVSENKLFPL